MSFNKKLWEQVRSKIITNLNMERVYSSFYLQDIGPTNPSGFAQSLCPFHEESSKSFSFALDGPDKGVWKCFTKCGQGDCFDFIEKVAGKTFRQSVEYLAERAGVDIPEELFGRYKGKKKGRKGGRGKGKGGKKKPRNKTSDQADPIKNSVIKTLEKALHSQPKLLTYLQDERGFTLETIKRFKIGWSVKSKRYTIPIFDYEGNARNIRKWKPKAKDRKIISHDDAKLKVSYGTPIRIFGHDDLKEAGENDYVLVCEGEPDRIAAHQLGYHSISLTGGCMSSWKPDWIPYFAGKKIAICFDADIEGKNAVQAKVIPFFLKAGVTSLKNISLPVAGVKSDKDLTDWLVQHSGDKEQLDELIEEADELLNVPPDDTDPIELDSFIQIMSNELIGKKVKCEITVCGETNEVFHAASKFRILHCKLQKSGGCICSALTPEYKLPHGSREYIGSCMSSDNQLIGMLRQFCCKQGESPVLEVIDRNTILEFFCHQKMERKSAASIGMPVPNQELFERKVYYISDKHPSIGTYSATGFVTSSPKTQQVTLLIEKLDEMVDDYKKFDVEDNLYLLDELSKFTIQDIVEYVRERVAKIYKRDDIMLCTLLTFCSPLWLEFSGEVIRGWITSAIIGDAGSGKTQSFRNFSSWCNIGDTFSGLTGSRTGLTYGLSEHKQKGWQVRIGRYPANNGKILMVDEVQFLPEEDIRTLSKAMEEGFLQIDRISSGGYESQTRLMLVGNPRKDRVMDNYGYGVEALGELFQPPVIRRLDLAVFAASSDIDDPEFINTHHTKEKIKADNLTVKHFRALIYWAWNIKKEDIIFKAETVDQVLDAANELSAKFGHAHDIPLVNPSDIRKKLARIAAAFAVLEVSMPKKKNGEIKSYGLEVLPHHVDLASGFLDLIYSNENAQLDEYSRQQGHSVSCEDYEEIAEIFIAKWKNEKRSHATSLFEDRDGNIERLPLNSYATFRRMVHVIRINRFITRADIAETLGVTDDAIKKHISILRMKGLIKATRYGYVKEPKFNLFIRRFEMENPGFFDFATDDEDAIDPDAVF